VSDKFCIHLFSGSSKIGKIRVDIEHPNATDKRDVFDWINGNSGAWPKPNVLLLDPDYDIQRKDKKLHNHGITRSLSASIKHRNIFLDWVYQNQFDEVIYLDQCSPKLKGYAWEYWLVQTGGWHTNRLLNHYVKVNETLTKEIDCSFLSRRKLN